MNMANAWSILGKDWESIVRSLSTLPDVATRVQATENLLIDARKLAKKLMAVHHPDKNPEDLEAAERFKHVQEALNTIESSTKAFKSSYEAMKTKAEQRQESDGFIVLK